jgi:hypothetical protein
MKFATLGSPDDRHCDGRHILPLAALRLDFDACALRRWTGNNRLKTELTMKRVADLVLAMLAGLVLLPPSLLVALWLKMDGGPVLVRPHRVGRCGRMVKYEIGDPFHRQFSLQSIIPCPAPERASVEV